MSTQDDAILNAPGFLYPSLELHPLALHLRTEMLNSRVLRSRLKAWMRWQRKTNQAWHHIDLNAWATHLLRAQGTAPITALNYIATVRKAYRDLAKSSNLATTLERSTTFQLSEAALETLRDQLRTSLEDRSYEATLRNPKLNKPKQADGDQTEPATHPLSTMKISVLLRGPDITTRRGIRDLAILSVMLCTGIRPDELLTLKTADVQATSHGLPALRIRIGDERLIPYSSPEWLLPVLNRWLGVAPAGQGYVFRPVLRNDDLGANSAPLTLGAIQVILGHYSFRDGRHLRRLRPLFLRKTYAWHLYSSGVPIQEIRYYLGHQRIESTRNFLGLESAEPPFAPTPELIEPTLHDYLSQILAFSASDAPNARQDY